MNVGGSVQQRAYRIARRDGATLMTAAADAGISIGEARLIDEEDLHSPPPPEAFEPLPTAARVAAPQQKEDTMVAASTDTPTGRGRGRKAKEQEQQQDHTEVAKPDFARAARLLRGDVKPAEEQNAKSRGDLSAAWKTIEDDCHVNKKAAKDAHKLANMSDETRDDYLRSLYGMMQELKIGISRDLVDQMGGAKAPQMPMAERSAPELHTVN
ncbi:hypothetical protein [Sphingomonas panaciterrae]|uniref:hypothetical protein n=1 Tax=Sphingomonas panaciterrae TaxID=1462999 RepID=UPI002FF3D80B